MKPKLFLLFLLLSMLLVGIWRLGDLFTLQLLKDSYQLLNEYKNSNIIIFSIIYFVLYVFSVALSLPGAVILTLAGGALFGIIKGTILVSFASSIGALLAFSTSRYLLRSFVINRFSNQYQQIKANFSNNQSSYLLSLRLAPIFPFFLINIIMGLLPISWKRFYLFSQLGMLPGTIVYVNAGSKLSELESAHQVLTPTVLISLILIAIFPYITRKILKLVTATK